MVSSCCAYGCSNRYGKLKENGAKLQFHRFPWKNHLLLLKWIAAVRRKNWEPTKVSLICGEHFSDDSYRTSCQTYLKDDAVPSIFNFSPQRKPRKKRQIVTEKPLNPVSTVRDTYTSHSEDKSEKISAAHCSSTVPPSTESVHIVKIVGSTKEMLQKELKLLQEKLRQKDRKIAELELLLHRTKKHCKMYQEIEAILEDAYG